MIASRERISVNDGMVSVLGEEVHSQANICISTGEMDGHNNRVVETSGFGIKCYQVKKARVKS